MARCRYCGSRRRRHPPPPPGLPVLAPVLPTKECPNTAKPTQYTDLQALLACAASSTSCLTSKCAARWMPLTWAVCRCVCVRCCDGPHVLPTPLRLLPLLVPAARCLWAIWMIASSLGTCLLLLSLSPARRPATAAVAAARLLLLPACRCRGPPASAIALLLLTLLLSPCCKRSSSCCAPRAAASDSPSMCLLLTLCFLLLQGSGEPPCGGVGP